MFDALTNGATPEQPVNKAFKMDAGMGHEDLFPPHWLNARCGFSQETFAGTHDNGETRRKQPLPVNSAR